MVAYKKHKTSAICNLYRLSKDDYQNLQKAMMKYIQGFLYVISQYMSKIPLFHGHLGSKLQGFITWSSDPCAFISCIAALTHHSLFKGDRSTEDYYIILVKFCYDPIFSKILQKTSIA